jgi:hypothetical protein
VQVVGISVKKMMYVCSMVSDLSNHDSCQLLHFCGLIYYIIILLGANIVLLLVQAALFHHINSYMWAEFSVWNNDCIQLHLIENI